MYAPASIITFSRHKQRYLSVICRQPQHIHLLTFDKLYKYMDIWRHSWMIMDISNLLAFSLMARWGFVVRSSKLVGSIGSVPSSCWFESQSSILAKMVSVEMRNRLEHETHNPWRNYHTHVTVSSISMFQIRIPFHLISERTIYTL